MSRLILSILFVFFLTSNAIAQRDGNEVLRGCNAIIAFNDNKNLSELDLSLSLFWAGYIAGYIDNAALYGKMANFKEFCIPEKGISTNQAAMIIAKYLKENPNLLHKSPRLCISRALADSFKCK